MIDFTDDKAPAGSYDPAKVVKGPIEHVAEKLRTYAETDCEHVICFLVGLTKEKTSKLAEAARLAGLISQ
jgi:hypothetical protein